MYEIKNKQTIIRFNHIGTITFWSDNPYITEQDPIYITFFKDYSHLDPMCKLLDLDKPIEVISQKTSEVIFTKTIGAINCKCKIAALDKGLDFDIQITNDIPVHHRFGITIPCSKNPQRECMEENIKTPVALFIQNFEEIFKDQTLLKAPYLFWNSNPEIIVFSNIGNNYQFFTYESEGVHHTRLTASTLSSTQLTVSVCNSTDPVSTIVGRHPQSDLFFNKWKLAIKDLEVDYKIPIVCQHQEMKTSIFLGKIHADQPTPNQLDSFARLFKREIKKYPVDIFQKLKIDGIYLCKNLKVENLKQNTTTIAEGMAIDSQKVFSWIIYDLSQLSDELIHHEIFHFIENLCNFDDWASGSYNYFPRCKNDDKECRAELFSALSVLPQQWKSKTDNLLKRQIELLVKKVQKIVPEFSFSSQETTTDFRKVYNLDGYDEIEFGKLNDKLYGKIICHDPKSILHK